MTNSLEFLMKINDLQKTKRYGNNPDFWESTAEHTFKLVQIVDYFYKELKLTLNYERCIRLALYHDFCEMDMDKDFDIKECTNDDVKKAKKECEEMKISELSHKYYAPIKDYFDEFSIKDTEEAKFVNACDKLEGMIHPLTVQKPIMNHEIFATYADKAISDFPRLIPFYKEIKKVLKEKYELWGFEWKKEYDEVFK